jgi:hypothetical protein
VPQYYLSRRADLTAGDRVRITAWALRDQLGTLIRSARLPNGKPAWLVQMDNSKGLLRGRTRVGDRYLARLSTDV